MVPAAVVGTDEFGYLVLLVISPDAGVGGIFIGGGAAEDQGDGEEDCEGVDEPAELGFGVYGMGVLERFGDASADEDQGAGDQPGFVAGPGAGGWQ